MKIKKKYKEYATLLTIAIFVGAFFYWVNAVEVPKHLPPGSKPSKLDIVFIRFGTFLPFLIVFLIICYNEKKIKGDIIQNVYAVSRDNSSP